MSTQLPVPQSSEEKTWGMACHLLALVNFMPLGNIIAPLIAWLIKRDEYPFVNDQGKESINFQITITGLIILVLVGLGLPSILIAVSRNQPPYGYFLAIGLAMIIGVFDLIFIVVAAVAVGNGKTYRYPFAIRFIK